jgi:threonyl-tRNA synthetase
LTEHWAGNFPTWLSPIQVQIITISEKHKEYANDVVKKLKSAGIRVKIDDSDNTIGKKIRIHRKMRPSYMAIIGDEETDNKAVSIRARDGRQRNGVPLEQFIEEISLENINRETKLSLVPEK